MGLPPGTYGKLKRCCYGTRDAGALWEECYARALVDLGFTRGKGCPTCFFHKQKQISVVVHGDDFVILANDAEINWLESELAKHFEIGDRSRLGTAAGRARESVNCRNCGRNLRSVLYSTVEL